jgi:hypothetical protein
MNKHAQALGRMNKGVPKHYSEEELKIRTLRLVGARKKRWISTEATGESKEHKDIYRACEKGSW